MHRFRTTLFIVCSLLLACRREEPNPELRDPIYLNLVQKTGELKSKREDSIKKLEELRKGVEKTAATTLERKLAEKDLKVALQNLEKLEQEYNYATIRTERRRVETRKSYRIAFGQNQTWPDPSEHEAYLANQRMRTASRRWDDHVPKLADRIPKPADSTKKKKEKPPEEE
jgi:hypothetical protein